MAQRPRTGIEPGEQPFVLGGVGEPFDWADVDADADDHSTVTDLARLRGWSTSVPLSTAT